MKSFEELGLSPQTLHAVKRLGIENPTQVQEEAIPFIMGGKDVVGESATGSGKTIAFGCRVIEKVNPKGGLQSLIIVPTRELAEQDKDYLRKLAYQRQLNIIAIYGGVSIRPQVKDIARANIVVATPGRLLDHLERRTIEFSKVKILVLDEVDRMFDMGFIDDIKRIIKSCPRKRQNLFFSATISTRVINLAKQYMENPVEVRAEAMVDPDKLTQAYYDVPKNLKLSLLVHLLQSEKSGLVMVFCNTRRTVDFLVKNLRANDIDAIAIHGGLTQNKRIKTIKRFHEGRVGVLVCTDVASRGLHVEEVSHIYNYDIPKDAKDYVHRIGRTARAGEDGIVINLLGDHDYENFSRVQHEYRDFTITKKEKPYLKRVFPIREYIGNRHQRRPMLRHVTSGHRFKSRSGRYI